MFLSLIALWQFQYFLILKVKSFKIPKKLKFKKKRGEMYLINYTRLNVRVITLLATLFIYVLLSYTFQNISNAYGSIKERIENNEVSFVKENKVVAIEEIKEEAITEDTDEEYDNDAEFIWQLEIPKIELIGPIASRNNTRGDG